MLRLSAAQLRLGIRSPDQLVRALKTLAVRPIPPDTPRSAQRPGMDASLRVYFTGARDPDVLRQDFADRTAKWSRREAAASEIANAAAMLGRFGVWDSGQPDPERVVGRPTSALVLGHDVTLAHDLVYRTPGGVALRQLLTDDTHGRSEHRRLYGAVCLAHFRVVYPFEQLERVDVWHLRFGSRLSWPASQLLRQLPEVERRLRQVELGLADAAA